MREGLPVNFNEEMQTLAAPFRPNSAFWLREATLYGCIRAAKPFFFSNLPRISDATSVCQPSRQATGTA